MKRILSYVLLVLPIGLIGCGPKKQANDQFGPDIDCVAEVNQRRAESAPAEKNAAVSLLFAIGPHPDGSELSRETLKWLGVDPLPTTGDYWQLEKDFFAVELSGSEGKPLSDVMELCRTKPWKSTDHPRIAEWLERNAKPFLKVKEAAASPAYYHPLVPDRSGDSVGSLLTSRLFLMAPSREMCRALLSRAMLHAGEGRTADAWDDTLAVHRLALHLTRGITVLEYVLGLSLLKEAMETEAALAGLEGTIASPSGKHASRFVASVEVPSPAKLMVGHKIQCRDVVQHFRRRGHAFLERVTGDETEGGAYPSLSADERQKLDGLDWGEVLRPSIDLADAAADAMNLPTFEQRKDVILEIEFHLAKQKRQLPDGLNYAQPDGLSKRCGILFLGLLAPNSHALNRAYTEAMQRHRNLLIAFALSSHYAESGKYPESLDDLAPQRIKVVPDDLFSVRPLIYRLTPDGFHLYSVGNDGQDDGGNGDDVSVQLSRERNQ